VGLHVRALPPPACKGESPAVSGHPRECTMNRFVWLLSHDEVNQDLARGLGAAHGLDVQVRFLKEGLPDGDCRALVVDLDSVAPESLALQRLVKELAGRPHAHPLMVVGYNLEDGQPPDLPAAGIPALQPRPAPA